MRRGCTSLPAAEVVDVGRKSGTVVGVSGGSKERMKSACVYRGGRAIAGKERKWKEGWIYKGIRPAPPRQPKYKRRGKKNREKKPLTHKVLKRRISTPPRKRPLLVMSSTLTHSSPAVLSKHLAYDRILPTPYPRTIKNAPTSPAARVPLQCPQRARALTRDTPAYVMLERLEGWVEGVEDNAKLRGLGGETA
jgi:hypothetical protein